MRCLVRQISAKGTTPISSFAMIYSDTVPDLAYSPPKRCAAPDRLKQDLEIKVDELSFPQLEDMDTVSREVEHIKDAENAAWTATAATGNYERVQYQIGHTFLFNGQWHTIEAGCTNKWDQVVTRTGDGQFHRFNQAQLNAVHPRPAPEDEELVADPYTPIEFEDGASSI